MNNRKTFLKKRYFLLNKLIMNNNQNNKSIYKTILKKNFLMKYNIHHFKINSKKND